MCITQMSYSQNYELKYNEQKEFKSAIADVLASANTAHEAESLINRLVSIDGEYITAQDKQNIANEYFEDCKKNLAKWDAKLANGKKISSDDAMYATNYYILGYNKICDQNYSKALEYIKLCPQIPYTKMYTVAIMYQQNKDKEAAKAAMNFIDKPTKDIANIATQFGLGDVYHDKIMSLIADKKQTIKRAIRSKDFETLLSYVPYDIPEVDSLFATNAVPIIIARIVGSNGSNFINRSIEDVEDFSDRNVIKIYKEGDDLVKWNSDYYNRSYFLKKCIYLHEMPWTVYAISRIERIEDVVHSLPVKLQLCAFAIKDSSTDIREPEYYKIENYLHDLCSSCDKNDRGSSKGLNKVEQDMINFIKSFQPQNMLASYLAAVMVQVYGQIGTTTTGFHNNIAYTTEFKMELFNATKEIVDQVPALKDNEYLPVTISSNGKVTIKEGCENPDEIVKNIYEPILNLMWVVYNNNK